MRKQWTCRRQALAQLDTHFQPWIEPERQQDKGGADADVQDQPGRDLDVGERGQTLYAAEQLHVRHNQMVAVGVILE